MRQRAPQAGFTLIELMVSLVMFSFAVAGVLALAVALVNGIREQRAVIGAESASRAGLEVMADAIRGASPGVSTAIIQTVDSASCGTNAAISVANNASATGADDLTVVYASGSVVTSSRTAYVVGSTALTVQDASEISAGDFLLITNYAQGSVVKVSSKAGNVLTLAAQTCGTLSLPAGGYGPGSLVVRVLRARFYIAPLDGVPTLWMDPDATGPLAAEPLAEGVEDMQIALGYDAAADGLSDVGASANDDEWLYNVAGETSLIGTFRAVRITLVVRATQPVSGTGTYTRPAAEDHAAGVTPDNYRRRLLTTTIEIRNLGASP